MRIWVLALFFVIGRPAFASSCTSDQDCKNAKICERGRCQPASCSHDDQCGAQGVCQDHLCEASDASSPRLTPASTFISPKPPTSQPDTTGAQIATAIGGLTLALLCGISGAWGLSAKGRFEGFIPIGGAFLLNDQTERIDGLESLAAFQFISTLVTAISGLLWYLDS